MKKLLLLYFLFSIAITSNAQMASQDSTITNDSLSKVRAKARSKAIQDSVEKALFAKATYPLIKSSKWAGVIPISNVDERPDVARQYKLLMEITEGIKDTAAAKEINNALAEVGRQMNIHIAAGIPKQNINMVVIAHGGVLKSFYNNAVYKEKYKVDNPNIPLFNELLTAGVKFIACGQAMTFLNIDKPQLLPWMKVALSAQSVITDYQLKGYVHRDLVMDR